MIHPVLRQVIGGVTLAAALLLPFAPARAELKPPVVAVVDVQYILQESTAGKSVQKAIESQRETYQKEIGAQAEKLRAAEQELTKQRTVLSQDAFAARRRDFEKQVGDMERGVQARRQAIDQALSEAMRTLNGTLLEVVAGLAQENGVNLVLYKHQVVIVEKYMDVTQEVLERFNRKLPSVAVKIPPLKPAAAPSK